MGECACAYNSLSSNKTQISCSRETRCKPSCTWVEYGREPCLWLKIRAPFCRSRDTELNRLPQTQLWSRQGLVWGVHRW